MTETSALQIGIIGMGFMGTTHARAYLNSIQDGAPASLVAVCDPDSKRRSGLVTETGNLSTGHAERLFEPGKVRGYERASELIGDDSIDIVSICTPSDSHVDLAAAALRAGKHVLVEKPVAIRASEIESLIQVERRSRGWCIPAMCVRYWPGWRELAEIVRSGELGRVRHAVFERLGSIPRWSSDFYSDNSRSGGAAFDLHVHDADFVRWIFGDPDEVFALGDSSHIAASYRYRDGPAVVARGGWMRDSAFPFSMSYLVEFEQGVVQFSSSPSPKMKLFTDGAERMIELPDECGYHRQADAVIRAIQLGPEARQSLPSLSDALGVTQLIERELKNAQGR